MLTALTILDYLNEDCWRGVLDYVPIRDIIRSEQTSRGWQEVVIRYLSQSRIGIQYPILVMEDVSTKTLYNARWLRLHEKYILSFDSWTSKLGTSVVACYCTDKSLKIVGEKCSNLEAALFLDVERRLLRNSPYENLTRLKVICFSDCGCVTDQCAAQFLASPILEELEFNSNYGMTGQCLKSIKSKNLKSLILHNCEGLECRHLLEAGDILSGLTKFVIQNVNVDKFVPEKKYEQIFQVLEKMPKLEELDMYVYEWGMYLDNFFEFICRFENLKELAVDFPVTDEDLETVARGCPALVSLNLEVCNAVTGRGLARLCACAGARLQALSLSRTAHVADDDVVACVRACPNLTELGLTACTGLSRGVLARVSRARRGVRARRPLRLLVFGQDLHDGFSDPEYEDYIGEFEGLELPYANVRTRPRWPDMDW